MKPKGLLIEGKPRLNEVNLSRMYGHWGENGFAALTSWRGDVDLSTNRKNLEELKRRIRSAGFGFIPVLGVYKEDKMPTAEPEPSLIIPATKAGTGEDGLRELKKLAIKWGQRYDQDSILFVDPGDSPQAVLVRTRDGDDVNGRYNVNRVETTFGRFRVGDHFIFRTAVGKQGRAAHNKLARGRDVKIPSNVSFATESYIMAPTGGGFSTYSRRFTGEVLPYSSPLNYPTP